MKTINQNLDTPQTEESKQNLSKSNSDNPLPLLEDTQKVNSPRKAKKQPEESVTLSGKVFNKQRYNQFKIALGVSGTLVMPRGMVNDGSDGYSYFWASTQYAGQIERKKALGYEVCTDKNKNNKEYRHFASQVDKDRHEHVLMRIKIEDRELISEIQREKKAFREVDQVLNNNPRSSTTFYEKTDRLSKDGESTFLESLQNKYNNNITKQV